MKRFLFSIKILLFKRGYFIVGQSYTFNTSRQYAESIASNNAVNSLSESLENFIRFVTDLKMTMIVFTILYTIVLMDTSFSRSKALVRIGKTLEGQTLKRIKL